jgi:hypothetical protein
MTVTGIRKNGVYAAGGVPRAGCATTDTVSGVLKSALVSVSGGPAGKVGVHTVTCAGAEDHAGNKTPAVQVRYTVVYSFGGFRAPRAGSTIAAGAKTVTVQFRLAASRKSVAAAVARALAAQHKVRVILTGPGIKPVTSPCGWNGKAEAFSCTIKLPHGIRTGHRNAYTLLVQENVGSGFLTAPGTGRSKNPEVIYFR